jgi:hypothetical protein
VVAVALVLAVGITGGAAVVLLGGGSSGVDFPDSIAGQPRMRSGALQGIADAVSEQAKLGSELPRVAFYGSEVRPEFLVMVYGFAVSDVDAAFKGALGGIRASTGGSARTGPTTTSTAGSATFECAPLDAPTVQGDFCLWGDGDTTGMVLTLTRQGSPLHLVQQVHDAVVD